MLVHAKMNLHCGILKPTTTAPCHIHRLRSFRDTQDITIESSRFIFSTCRHRQLNVVDPYD
jgi:hypothetical protein